MRGDWRARPLDEWGDRGGGAGRGRGGRPGAGSEWRRPAPQAVNGPHALRVEEGSGGRAVVPGPGVAVGPGSDGGPGGVAVQTWAREVGLGEEKPRPPLRPAQRASPPP